MKKILDCNIIIDPNIDIMKNILKNKIKNWKILESFIIFIFGILCEKDIEKLKIIPLIQGLILNQLKRLFILSIT